MKTAFITGISGQDGGYLAQLLLSKGYKVIGITRNNHPTNLYNLSYLGIQEEILFEEGDLCDLPFVIRILEKHNPQEIYNLAAQSSVGLSFAQPTATIHYNISSVLNLLEAIRIVDSSIKLYQASSSEMFGKVSNLPVTLTTPMHPLSPYAISKATNYWTVINFRESYNMFVCNGILFNHESYLRSNTFFVKKVLQDSFKIKNGKLDHLRVGNIDVKRDFGFAPKYVEAMWLMLQQNDPRDFIICSGRSISLRHIIEYIFDKLSLDKNKVVIDPQLYRPTDILDIYGDNTAAQELLGWSYTLKFEEVLDQLIQEEEQNLTIARA
ncbi:MAG TPA: GDP-mannose 4,6-dehydratase [Ohtaekwangia sp.]|uniref:GDP-mannose 4,6-dehydratase n=1 Tax=Ohtaekwangia sp. TaxID=2066019 RepID=UPI002F931F03